MDRRQILQVISACTVLPISVSTIGKSAESGQATSPQLAEIMNVVEQTQTAWDIPKIGIVSVGEIGRTYLSESKNLREGLPYLNRTIAIATSTTNLSDMKADRKVLLSDGKTLLNPQSAGFLVESAMRMIAEPVAGLDMVLLVAGMDNKNGSEIAPMVAKVLRQNGILTLGFADMPSDSASPQCQLIAQSAVRELRQHVDGLIPYFSKDVAPENKEIKWLSNVALQAPMAFFHLCHNIMNPVCRPGFVNIDFEDLRHLILSHEGDCAFGFGSARYQNGAENAARHAMAHPLLGQERLIRASAVLVAIGASPQVIRQKGPNVAIKNIRSQLNPDAWIIYGIDSDPNLGDETTVSILASGIRET